MYTDNRALFKTEIRPKTIQDTVNGHWLIEISSGHWWGLKTLPTNLKSPRRCLWIHKRAYSSDSQIMLKKLPTRHRMAVK